jgi:hypothetical protein
MCAHKIFIDGLSSTTVHGKKSLYRCYENSGASLKFQWEAVSKHFFCHCLINNNSLGETHWKE